MRVCVYLWRDCFSSRTFTEITSAVAAAATAAADAVPFHHTCSSRRIRATALAAAASCVSSAFVDKKCTEEWKEREIEREIERERKRNNSEWSTVRCQAYQVGEFLDTI